MIVYEEVPKGRVKDPVALALGEDPKSVSKIIAEVTLASAAPKFSLRILVPPILPPASPATGPLLAASVRASLVGCQLRKWYILCQSCSIQSRASGQTLVAWLVGDDSYAQRENASDSADQNSRAVLAYRLIPYGAGRTEPAARVRRA